MGWAVLLFSTSINVLFAVLVARVTHSHCPLCGANVWAPATLLGHFRRRCPKRDTEAARAEIAAVEGWPL